MNEQFEKIYFQFKDDVYRLALSYTQNKSDAEDIVQRTFIKVYKNMNNIQNGNQKKYLLKICSNECKDFFKSFWHKKITSIEDNELFEIKNNNLELFELLKVIPKKYRISLHLYYFYGYSIKEIAEIEKTNENTIKTRLSRGRKLLKDEMESEETNEKNI